MALPPILNALLGASVGAQSQGALLPQFGQLQERNRRVSLLDQINAAGGVTTPEGLQIAQQDPTLTQQLQSSELQQAKFQQIEAGQLQASRAAGIKQRATDVTLSAKDRQQAMMEFSLENPDEALKIRELFGNMDDDRRVVAISEMDKIKNLKGANRDQAILRAITKYKQVPGMEGFVGAMETLPDVPDDEQDQNIDQAISALLPRKLMIEQIKKNQGFGKNLQVKEEFDFLKGILGEDAAKEAIKIKFGLATEQKEQLKSDLDAMDTRFDRASKLRGEVAKSGIEFEKVKSATARLNAVDATPAGDLSLIFNFLKILDPGSTVRESEFATAEGAASVPERFKGAYNKAVTGKKLTTGQRADFLKQGNNLFKTAETSRSKALADFITLGKRFDLEEGDIIVSPIEQAAPAPANISPAMIANLKARSARGEATPEALAAAAQQVGVTVEELQRLINEG